MILFSIILTIVILQRLIELMVARKNERIMLSKGAFEAGSSHYPYMIALHVSFFLSLIIEVVLFDKEISLIFPYLFT
ncbi:isoprenylcysteine carboxyl methyltransferase, partial [Butyricicoccus sp. 1XD8-22]